MFPNKKMFKKKRKHKSPKEITSNHYYNNKKCLVIKILRRTNKKEEAVKVVEVAEGDINVDTILKRLMTIKVTMTRVETQTKTENMETQLTRLSEEERNTKPSTDVN